MDETEKRLTVVTLLLGRYDHQVIELDDRLRECSRLQKTVNAILVADDDQWLAAPQLQMFRISHPQMPVLCCPQNRTLPAQAMSMALEQVRTEYVMFSLLGDPVSERLDFLRGWWKDLPAKEKAKLNDKSEKEETHPAFYIGPYNPSAGGEGDCTPLNAYGWVQTSRIGLGLGAFVVPTDLLRGIGGFDENPLLQTEIERWYALAVTARCNLINVGQDTRRVQKLAEYPLEGRSSIPEDLAIRYATYCQGIAAAKRTPDQCARDFYGDLNEREREIYQTISGISGSERKKGSPYKILVVGGYWEYHHNQICFFNYLERLYGTGFATYRSVMEYTTASNLALGYDLVIFTRCRSKRALDMMRLCNEKNIPTMYMIDDNWLSIASDHPKEGAIFVPGNENYDNFIEALGLCKATWLFNDILREDVLPYTRCVKKFQISVDPRSFAVDRQRKREDDKLYIGYSGSLRYDDTAFRALARYARRHKNVRVILAGALDDKQEQLFKGIETIRMGFTTYSEYAQNIARLQPDLLIAPLLDTRFYRSKCYNKYIESGVIGAACIYSKARPYTDVVKDGVNGYLLEDETEEGWYRKLTEVLKDIPSLRRVQQAAKEDVLTRHCVDVVLDLFVQKLRSVIEEAEPEDD